MKIAAYCRVSTDKDEQLDSLAHQKEFFIKYATKNRHELVRVNADEGISGTSLKKRVEFQRLLQDAKSGVFQMVVVKDISRFARNTVDFLQSIRTLKALGINTLFLTANMESLGESEFILTVFSALAQEESINLSKRVKFGKKINAQKGRVPRVIFGYNRIDNFTLEINPKEAEIVCEIYRLYLESGYGCRKISLELNRLGHKTKYDCEWNPRGVRRILTDSIYCGEYVNNKYEIKDCLEGTRARIPPKEQFHHERPEWAIISKEMFQRTQVLLNERRKQFNTERLFNEGRHSSRHLFSTLIKCEHCRKHYTHKNTRVYWKCTTNDQLTAEKCDNRVAINENELIDSIREYLSSLIKDKESFIQSVLFELEKLKNIPPKNINEVGLKKKLRELNSKKEKYQEMYASDVISMEELKEKMFYLNKNIEDLKEVLKQVNVSDKIKVISVEDVRIHTEEIEDFLALESVSNGDLRKIISQIIVNREGDIKIYLRKFSDFSIE